MIGAVLMVYFLGYDVGCQKHGVNKIGQAEIFPRRHAS